MMQVFWSVLTGVAAVGVDRWGVVVAVAVAALHGVACASVLRRLDLQVRHRSERGELRGKSVGPPGFERSATDREPPMR
jgi:hypothetical protein